MKVFLTLLEALTKEFEKLLALTLVSNFSTTCISRDRVSLIVDSQDSFTLTAKFLLRV